MPHIVDQLIEERARRLMSQPAVWRLVKALIYPLLGYSRAVDMADRVRDMTGLEVFRYLSSALEMQVEVTGLEHVPATGRAMITPNHPAGIADGVALYDALKRVRDDITFFANRDAVRVAPALTDMIVPVEWMAHKRTHERNKETVKHVVRAFRDERLIVIFPSGRLAQPTWRGLVERDWMPTALNLAQKYSSPVLPMHVTGRNSWLYYLFYFVHTELRDMTLFRELLNKRGQHYQLRIGAPFQPVGDPRELTRTLREFVVHDLPLGRSRFDPATLKAGGTETPG